MACRVKFIIAQKHTDILKYSIIHNNMNDFGINAWLIWWIWEKRRLHCILTVWLFKWWDNPSRTHQHIFIFWCLESEHTRGHDSGVYNSNEERMIERNMKGKYRQGNPKRIDPTHTSLQINPQHNVIAKHVTLQCRTLQEDTFTVRWKWPNEAWVDTETVIQQLLSLNVFGVPNVLIFNNCTRAFHTGSSSPRLFVWHMTVDPVFVWNFLCIAKTK